MRVQKNIIESVQAGMKNLYGAKIPPEKIIVQPVSKDFKGTHAIILYPLLPSAKESNHLLGKKLGRWLTKSLPIIASYEVVKGFLNLTLTDSFWCEALHNHIEANQHTDSPKKIIIEIAAPNTNKPLHLGHLRNTFTGDAVANILSVIGHDIYKLMHVNDRGIHICKSMYAYQQEGQGKTPADLDMKGDHFVGKYYVAFEKIYKKEISTLTEKWQDEKRAKEEAPSIVAVREMLRRWERGEPEVVDLWEMMNNWVYQGFDATYERLNIDFDKHYYESETYLFGKKIIQDGLKEGIFYQKEDSSVWVDLTAEGFGQKSLLRGDNTSIYITQDIGTADLREKDFNADRSIYVVGDEQKYHFNVLFSTLKKLKRSYAPSLYHLAHGMVDLPTGKMKSREGTVVDVDDLIDKMVSIAKEKTQALGKTDCLSPNEMEKLHEVLALGALKFYLLRVNPQKRICFDPNSSLDVQGNTGTFIQYTHARLSTMLNKANKEGIIYDDRLAEDTTLAPIEKELIVSLTSWWELLLQATKELNPALVAQYLYKVAKVYNKFYATLPILREENDTLRNKRLYLSHCTMMSLRNAANLLGIILPDKM